MSTSASMAAIAGSQAAIAQAAAHQAKVERCKAEIATFDSKTNTIQQAQSYADCVQTVYPQEMTGGGLVAMKALFVFALVCAALGGWRAIKDPWNSWIDGVMFAGLWFICGPFALVCVLGIFYGVYWVIA